MKKQILLLFFALLPMVAMADANGRCGGNLTWTFNEATKTLTISGDGRMNDYGVYGNSPYRTTAPWFGYQENIQSVVIGSEVNSIGRAAFAGLTQLSFIIIPGNVNEIGQDAFLGCSNLSYIRADNPDGFSTYISPENCNALIDRYSATLIVGCKNTIIPDCVTSIGSNAFYACTGLTSITIPNSVTTIGANAFAGCTGLTSITIPNSVTTICANAFAGCTGLTSVTFSNILESIDSSAFSGCTGLTSVTLPNSVTTIGGGAFSGCTGLTSVTLSTSLTTIEGGAFRNCTGMTSVMLPNSLTNIGYGAFSGCTGLSHIEVDRRNPVYDSRMDCNAIIETSTNTLIAGCKNSIIPPSVAIIGRYAFDGCTGLTSITIPISVVTIEGNAFRGCPGLTSITLPNSLITIEENAFRDCTGLTSITIPASVASIGNYAFNGCKNLTAVTMLNPTPLSITQPPFLNIQNITLYVPSGSVEAYQADNYWGGFKRVVAIGSDDPEVEKCATPTITYHNGKLTFMCETPDAVCHSTITNADINSYTDSEIQLSVTYTIMVYASRDGYDDSDVATGTLCWIDVDPEKQGISGEDGVSQVKALPVLIQCNGNVMTIAGTTLGTHIGIYDLSGRSLSNATSAENITKVVVPTTEKVVLVKVGERTIKVAR